MTGQLELWVDGTHLSSFCRWGEFKWSTLADGGCGQASWRVLAPATLHHPALRRNAEARAYAGASRVWGGLLSQIEDGEDGWTITADGYWAAGAGFKALDGAGASTRIPDVAADRAIGTGDWPVTRPTSLSGAALATDDDAQIIALTSLLADWGQSVSKRVGVNADGELYAAADPTTPKWHVLPGSARFGLADDDYASDVYVRYFDGTAFKVAHAGDTAAAEAYGRKEEVVDATDLGILTPGTAANLATGAIAKGLPRLGWTRTLTLVEGQVRTVGGGEADLFDVRGGEMMRVHGVTDDRGQPVPYVDFVIGASQIDRDARTIEIAPVGLAARDLASVLTLAVMGGAA